MGNSDTHPEARTRPAWVDLPDELLLQLRFCDLRLRIRGSALQRPLLRLRSELAARGFASFRPHVWLSTEWFSPDGVAGFALPFYLAHPRLRELERRLHGPLEGENEEECLRLLRHETGHALLNAYGLHRSAAWRRVFGRASTPYRKSWRPDPSRRDFVQHLAGWYAQSHPVEDFCETFAVWLRPGDAWRQRYACWPALEKLKWVASEMQRIAPLPPAALVRERTEELRTLRDTLALHHRRKERRYATVTQEPEDRALDRLFEPATSGASEAAADWLSARRALLLRRARRAAGVELYATNQVLGRWIQRCFERRLRTRGTSLTQATDALLEGVHSLLAGEVPELTR